MLTRPDRTGQPARENHPGDHRERSVAYQTLRRG
jgi:hypothetical protein